MTDGWFEKRASLWALVVPTPSPVRSTCWTKVRLICMSSCSSDLPSRLRAACSRSSPRAPSPRIRKPRSAPVSWMTASMTWLRTSASCSADPRTLETWYRAANRSCSPLPEARSVEEGSTMGYLARAEPKAPVRTQAPKDALRTGGTPGVANLTPMPDQIEVGGVVGLGRGDASKQSVGLVEAGSLRTQAQSPAQAVDVR